MASINLIKASDGTGNASTATVQTVRNSGVTTIIVDTVNNIPATFMGSMGTPHTFVDPVTSEEITVISEATAVDFTGHVSGANLEIDSIAPGYTDLGSAVGDIVVIRPTTEWANNVAAVIDVEHNDNGTHGAVTADSIVTTGNVTIGGSLTIGGTGSGGWDPISGTITAVAANGNRSYSLTTSADNTALVSPGMRLRTTRTVAAPTQCTSLNGTTQYYSKASPNGMTFTDDFVVSAWIKLTSYNAGCIASRYNGTSGWYFRTDANGAIALYGTNAASGNNSYVGSYQSVPLNKWVHVAAQLDMSTFTATTTTSYVMIDGVNVPATVGRAGTNPTAIVQAGNLEIGSFNGGSAPFGGKIAQVAIYSAKVTQATMRSYMSQGLVGTETSLISAYSFNNTINDLNTTNANNLTANGSAVATNADSPFGGQAGGTISSTLDYGIVQTVSASTIVVQVAEGCTIPTSGGVSAVSYSSVKAPFGFPSEVGKWRLESINKAVGSQASATPGTWYNLGSKKITIPIGTWVAGYEVSTYLVRGAAASIDVVTTLSTSSSSENDSNFTSRTYVGSCVEILGSHKRERPLDTPITTATPYYLLHKTSALNNSIDDNASVATCITYVQNAYI